MEISNRKLLLGMDVDSVFEKSKRRFFEDGRVLFSWHEPARYNDDQWNLMVYKVEGRVSLECYESRELTQWVFRKTEKGFECDCYTHQMEGIYIGEAKVVLEVDTEDIRALEYILNKEYTQ